MTTRDTIRHAVKSKRQQLALPLLQEASQQITEYIARTSWFINSQRLAFYCAVRHEIDPQPLLQLAWDMGKTCYLPVCDLSKTQALSFVPHCRNEALFANRYGILEPSMKTHAATQPFLLDIAFTPLLAFDSNGNRLGSGKGFYDRAFAYRQRCAFLPKPELVGLAYAFQEVEHLATAPWDVGLQKVIIFDTQSCAVKELDFSAK